MGKQTEVEELQKKHLEAIVQFVEQGHAGNIAGKKEAATACTTITLQTVVEVLEKLKDKMPGAWAYIVEPEITEYTNLLNQNK